MKDPVKQFEELDGRINKLFEANFLKRLFNRVKPTNKSQTSSPQSKSLSSTTSSDYEDADTLIKNYKKGLESGAGCTTGVPNGQFKSAPGSNSAIFLTVTTKPIIPITTGQTQNKKFNVIGKPLKKTFHAVGKVDDISKFLSNAHISKEYLNCYDIKKDPLKIKWLFNGAFDAKTLDWDENSKKVKFTGTWKGGFGVKFDGILVGSDISPEKVSQPQQVKPQFVTKNKGIGKKIGIGKNIKGTP